MRKKLVSLLLSIIMVTSMVVIPAQAAYAPQHTAQAETLYELGLFRGTGTNPDGTPIYALDKTATRMQGLIMLIRLLGEEEEALAYTGACPFTDVSGNSAKYAAYAYSKGYTTGTTATTFGNGPLKANAFLTFTLRALGYNDKAGDFTYGTAFLKAAEIGLIAGGECTDQSQGIYRDVCAQVSHNALVTNVKGGGTLVDKLIDAGAVDAKKAEASGILKAQPVYGSNRDHKAYDAALTNMMTSKVKAAAKNAKYYGLDESIAWIAEPKTTEEFINNVYCCFLVGDYSLYNLTIHNEANAKRFIDTLALSIFDMSSNNPQLMGAFCNGRVKYGFYETRDGSYFRANMDLGIQNAVLSNEEIYRQQNEAMEAAYAISKQLHDSGKIKSGMTQKEIAQVYYDYLQKLGVKVGDVGFGAKNPGENMKYDTVYSCLVQKSANCMGRAAAYNVLMHIEGISAQAVQCHGADAAEGNNHVLNRVVLDGVEYVCDWGNKLPIQSVESASSEYEFFEASLETARAASAGKIQTESKPAEAETFTIPYYVEDAKHKKYAYDLQDVLLEVPNAYSCGGGIMDTNDADKKFKAADFSLLSLYLARADVRWYCSGLSDTLTPIPDKMTRKEGLELGPNTYTTITVIDKDCRILAYCMVGPDKKNDGKLVFTRCDFAAPEEAEAVRAANLAAYQNAVKVDVSAFTFNSKNNILTADMSKLPDGVKDFKYFASKHRGGNATTEEQMVRGAIMDVMCDPLRDTIYSSLLKYGSATNGGNPIGDNAVLLLYNADKVLVGYCLVP